MKIEERLIKSTIYAIVGIVFVVCVMVPIFSSF